MAKVQRKLKTPEDPKMTSKKGTGKKAAAPKATTTKSTTKKAAAPKTTGKKSTGTKKDAADKKFDAARAKHLREEKKKGATASLEARLKKRLAAYSSGIKKAKKSQATVRKLLVARQKATRGNLILKQKAARTNLEARQKARLDQRVHRKPVIKGDKVVTPKAKKVKVKLVKPKLNPIPHLKDGKIVTSKQNHKKGTAAQKSGAKKAAKTKAKGTVEV